MCNANISGTHIHKHSLGCPPRPLASKHIQLYVFGGHGDGAVVTSQLWDQMEQDDPSQLANQPAQVTGPSWREKRRLRDNPGQFKMDWGWTGAPSEDSPASLPERSGGGSGSCQGPSISSIVWRMRPTAIISWPHTHIASHDSAFPFLKCPNFRGHFPSPRLASPTGPLAQEDPLHLIAFDSHEPLCPYVPDRYRYLC